MQFKTSAITSCNSDIAPPSFAVLLKNVEFSIKTEPCPANYKAPPSVVVPNPLKYEFLITILLAMANSYAKGESSEVSS